VEVVPPTAFDVLGGSVTTPPLQAGRTFGLRMTVRPRRRGGALRRVLGKRPMLVLGNAVSGEPVTAADGVAVKWTKG
jgi:hypothetical protein